jgi:hypothetical protein
MAAFTKAAIVDIDGLSAQRCVMITELFNGDSFGKLDPVYIDSTGAVKAAFADSTGLFYDGFASVACDSVVGHPVTILGRGLIMTWVDAGDSMLPGSFLYVGAAGGLADAVAKGEATGALAEVPVAKAISATEIIVIK